MSLGFAIVAYGCAFCAGVGAMLWSRGSADNNEEDYLYGRACLAVFTVGTVAMLAGGVWWK